MINSSNAKLKNNYVFEIQINNNSDAQAIISKFFSFPEFVNKKDIKIFLNNEEISNTSFGLSQEKKDTSNIVELKKEYVEEKLPEEKKVDSKKIVNTEIEKNVSHSKFQLTIENISDSMSKEKIHEIFFIYGDIKNIFLIKEEVR